MWQAVRTKVSSEIPFSNIEKAVGNSFILGFSRYGHPEGTVYLPRDRAFLTFVDSSKDHRNKYSPTWEQFQQFWELRERGTFDLETMLRLRQSQHQPRLRPREAPLSELLHNLATFSLADSPSNLIVTSGSYVASCDIDHGPKIKRFEVEGVHAVVICAPNLTTEVAQSTVDVLRNLNGHKVGRRAFIPSRDNPAPFECEDKTMIIRLGLPPGALLLLRKFDCWMGIRTETENGMMDELLLYVTEVDDIPTISSFAYSRDVAESMEMTFESNYWKLRFRGDSGNRDISRRLPLPFFWYAVRRWDEFSEAVNTLIISLSQEDELNTQTARQLHILRSYILDSEGLFIRFKSIINEIKTGTEDDIVTNECTKLLLECERFESERKMREERVKSLIDMIFSYSSARTAAAAVRDGRDMRQVSRLTMLFLPASIMAGIFSINSTVFDAQTSLKNYLLITIPFTMMVIWVFVAIQVENYFVNFPAGGFRRFLWPFYMFSRRVGFADEIV